MTASVFEAHTILPPERPQERAQLRSMLDALNAALSDGSQASSLPEQSSRAFFGTAALLLGPDGPRVEIPHELFEVLLELAQAMSEGRAITVAPHSLTMTTQQAAEFLGVSRPTLVKLLERGEIPFDQPNRHRRVRLPDLMAYQQRRSAAQRAALDELTRDAEDLGLYDQPAPVERVRD